MALKADEQRRWVRPDETVHVHNPCLSMTISNHKTRKQWFKIVWREGEIANIRFGKARIKTRANMHMLDSAGKFCGTKKGGRLE